MTRPRKLSTALVAVAVVTATLTAVLTGPGVPTGFAASTEPSKTGSLNFTSSNLTWFDFAVLQDGTVDPEDVHAQVTFLWNRTHEGDRTQRWVRGFAIARYDQDADLDVYSTVYFNNGDSETDGVHETIIEVGPVRQEVEFAKPWYALCGGLMHCNSNARAQSTVLLEDILDLRRDRAPYVVHFVIAASDRPMRAIVNATWTDATVNTSHGPIGDEVNLFREDFDHDLYARTDGVTSGVSYERGAKLDVDLVDPGRSVVFYYLPKHGAHDWDDTDTVQNGTARFIRPDGSQHKMVRDQADLEASSLAGTWTFMYNRSVSDPVFGEHEEPVVLGTQFDPARIEFP